jgi:predicted RNase H-like HicB family nuclease
MEIEYNVQIWKEGHAYIAHAMPLDVASSGDTPDQARSALEEAVQLFLETSVHQGTLEEVLEDAGYQRETTGWRSPAWVALERHHALVEA